MPDTQFLTLDDVAATLNLSPEEVGALVDAGDLTAVVMSTGGAPVFWPPQVLALAARSAADLTVDALKGMSPQQIAQLPPAKLAKALAKPKAPPAVAPKPPANAGAMQ